MAYTNATELEDRRTADFLKAMGLSWWRNGPALSIDEIAERYLRISPGMTLEKAKQSVPRLLDNSYSLTWSLNTYKFESVRTDETEQRKYRIVEHNKLHELLKEMIGYQLRVVPELYRTVVRAMRTIAGRNPDAEHIHADKNKSYTGSIDDKLEER